MKPKYKIGERVRYNYHSTIPEEKIQVFDIKDINIVDNEIRYFDSTPDDLIIYRRYILESNIIDNDTIIEDNLKVNGWNFDDEEYRLTNFKIKSWKKTFKNNDKTYYCTLQPFSNTIGRNWFVHVDNSTFESVGTMDVNYYNQIDRFLKLLSE